MATREVARDFDEISAVYDETRDPLDALTIARLIELLREDGLHVLLEVGVGTGRIGQPLTDAGLSLTGVDASRGMLRRARTKGLQRLVRGNAYRLPFAGAAFDGALFVHVLHLLDDPRTALREAIRVSRRGAFALVHPAAPDAPSGGEPPVWMARRTVYRILREKGYDVPDTGGGPPVRERRLLGELPPDRIDIVSDREVTQPVSRSLRMIERGASRHTLRIPRPVLEGAVREAEAEIGDRTLTYRRIESLARWSSLPEGAPGP